MEVTAVEMDFELCRIVEDGILYFKDNLQTDSWKKSDLAITGSIKNIFNQWLEAHPDEPDGVIFTEPGSDTQTFELQLYKTTSFSDGVSVAFSVKYKGVKYHLCCTEDMKLYFKKGDCPETIAGTCSNIIFFQKQFSDGDDCFKFQSSLQADYYLAVSDEGGKQKLVLQKCKGFNEKQKFDIRST
ncbi:interleukin-18 [Leptodactylus fuscus]|uniref:interleukin-18 n=1 Tax=Leptodactylus fuscus TaxID=238119 RepID=UPI003F4EBD96